MFGAALFRLLASPFCANVQPVLLSEAERQASHLSASRLSVRGAALRCSLLPRRTVCVET